MALVEEVLEDPTLVLQFPDPETLTPPILQFRDVSFGYGEGLLFKNVNVGIDLDSRVALVEPVQK
jgi:ATPase subunit of ABC transporter with duplicated ATPase domains